MRQVAFFGDKNSSTKKISVFDTTLRDGEQTPGVSFTLDQKLDIARAVSGMGVSVIEAGFPASSESEFETVKMISSLGLEADICGLARSVVSDVDRCIECDVDMVHVFIPTSDVQRENTIRKTREEVLEITSRIVGYARENVDKVLFSAMDATRTEVPYLIEVFRAAVDAGATTINVPDTVGVATPSSMSALVSAIRGDVKCPIDVHCHNDFSMAVANSVSAVEAGASQVQVTVNGIGERAGNADFASTVMALESILGFDTGVRTENLVKVSRMVSRYSGISVLPVHPVVGDNAFAHESGIHSHGVIANSSTFEPGIMTPEMVGHRRRLKLGKHVGKHAVRQMLGDVGMNPSEDELDAIVAKIKDIASRGKKIEDNDLYEIADTVCGTGVVVKDITLDGFAVMTGSHVLPSATVRAIVNGEEKVSCMTGNGSVDAAMKALLNVVSRDVVLKDFNVAAISGGSDAIGHVSIAVEDENGRVFDAGASNADIVMASVEAMVNALNMVYRYDKNDN